MTNFEEDQDSSISHKECSICHSPYIVLLGHRHRLYCSNKCRQQAYRLRKSAQQHASEEYTYSASSHDYCLQCHHLLSPIKQRSTRRYCSHRCRQKAYHLRHTAPQTSPSVSSPTILPAISSLLTLPSKILLEALARKTSPELVQNLQHALLQDFSNLQRTP